MAAAFMNTALDLMKYLEKNWALLVEDIKNGSISPEIKIPDEQRAILQKDIRPNPARAEALRKEFEKGFHDPIIPRIWKDFAWMGSIGGGGFSTYTEKMRHYLGNIPIYFSIYGASEGLMAVPNRMDTEEMLLIPGNIFFEFIPLGGENSQSTETLTMDQLEKGKDYEIVLTNSSGFCRYRILDAIRVTGFYKNCPTIKFIYRLSQSVNLAGEKTNDEALGWAVKETSKKAGFEVVEYSVYPDTDVSPGRYVVFIEGENFGKDKDIARFRDILEEKLDIANPSLGQKVREGILSPSVLHLLQPETFALYRDLMVLRGISANQLKPVRLIDTTVRQKFFFALIDNEAE